MKIEISTLLIALLPRGWIFLSRRISILTGTTSAQAESPRRNAMSDIFTIFGRITDNVEETEEERRFVYDQNDLLIAEYLWDGDSWELSREYVNDSNGVVCTIDYDYRDWGGYELGWHLRDHLGSTVAVVAKPVVSVPPGNPQRVGQQILWTGKYESFGLRAAHLWALESCLYRIWKRWIHVHVSTPARLPPPQRW
jgi:hypothetical protein